MVLPGLMLAILLAMLDNMIVGTAMPRIVGELGGLDHLSWVVTAYMLGTTVSTPLWGKIGDLYGRKNIFLTSIVIFLVGSALSGMAQSMGQLSAFRALQGLGAGGLLVGAMAIIGDLVPPRERGRYQGLMAGVMALAMIAGPLAGGFITDNLDWRWAFYVNLPLGAARAGPAGRPAAPAEVPHRAPHRLARRRPALGRHHRAGAHHHLGRRPVRLGLVADHRPRRAGVVTLVGVRRRRAAGGRSRSCRWGCSATATSPWSRASASCSGSRCSARSASCRSTSRPCRARRPPTAACCCCR